MPEQGLNGPCCRLEREICAIGADGLIVEVHPAAEKAIFDGAQLLDIG
jgi:3-deoxy-D-arabino-heptulosonate 7-phosphate (DAHP) synthase